MKQLINYVLTLCVEPKFKADIILLMLGKKPCIFLEIKKGPDPSPIFHILSLADIYSAKVDVYAGETVECLLVLAKNENRALADNLKMTVEHPDANMDVTVARLLGRPETLVEALRLSEGRGMRPKVLWPDDIRQNVLQFPLSTAGYEDEIATIRSYVATIKEHAPSLHEELFGHFPKTQKELVA